jgi:hypothetical protein
MRGSQELPGAEKRGLDTRYGTVSDERRNSAPSMAELRGKSRKMREDMERARKFTNDEEERREREFADDDSDEADWRDGEDVMWQMFNSGRPYFADMKRGRVDKQGRGGLFGSKRLLSQKSRETS